jgi:translocation and assembly module TamB
MASVLRIGIKFFFVGVALVVVLIGGALLALRSDAGRDLACGWILDWVNEAIPGEILVGRCAALGPAFVALEDTVVRDPSKRTILSVDRIEAEPNLLALLRATIEIEAVRAQRPALELVDYGDELAIVAAFVAPNGTSSADDDPNTDIALVFGSIEITNGRLSSLPDDRIVEHIEVRTSLAWKERVVLEVEQLEANLLQRGESVAWLRDGAGALRFGDDAKIDAQASIEGLGANAEVDAHFEGDSQRFSLDTAAKTLGGRLEAHAVNDAGQVEANLVITGIRAGDAISSLRGTIDGRLDAELSFSEPIPARDALLRIDATAELSAQALEVSEIRADSLELHGRMEGPLSAPYLYASVDAHQVELQGESLQSLRFVIEGRDGSYRARGQAPLPNGWLVGVNLDSEVDWPRISLDGDVSLAGSPLSPLEAKVSRLVIQSGERVSAQEVTVVGRGIDLQARGRYDLDGALDVSARLRTMDLSRLGGAFGSPMALEGALRGTARATGTRQAPELSARFHLADGSLEGVRIASLRTEVDYNATQRRAETRGSATVGEGGEVSFEVRADLSSAEDLEVALTQAHYDATLRVESLSANVVSRLVDGMPEADGTIASKMSARGSLDDLALRAAAYGDDISFSSSAPVDLYLEATLDDGEASARVEAASHEGTAAIAAARAHLNPKRLANQGAAAEILARPWAISLQVPEQPLAALPIELGPPTSARGSLQASFSGDSGFMRGDFDVDLRFPERAPAEVEACEERRPARVRMTAKLRNQATAIELIGYVAHEKILDAHAETQTPVETWIERGWPARWPSMQARVDLEPVALGTVPFVCRRATGELRADLQATNLFEAAQQIALRMESEGLSIRDSTPVNAIVRVEADAQQARAEAGVESNERKLVRVEAEAPIELQDGPVPIGLGTGSAQLSADFDDAPLALLLAPVPVVSRPEGQLGGHLSVAGDAQDPSQWELRGEIDLAGASMTLRDPFLRLDDVDADLTLHRDRWVVESLTVHDREGRIEAQGSIGVSGWKPRDVALTLDANDYPLRREGVSLATMNGQIEITGELSGDPRVIRIELGQEVSLALPDEFRYGVQSLAQHPLVIYEGQPGFDRTLNVEEALERHRRGLPAEEEGAPLIAHVTSSEPFWVRRADFAFQLTTDLEVHSEQERLWLQGEVGLRRGFLSVLNKNFDLESGTLRFTGSTPIDPTVDLTANHRLRSGYVVTIDAEGRLSELDLTFSTDAPGANTNAEVIALLLGVSRHGPGDQRAASQTRSVLAGLTAGLVGSVARRELGQYAPIIAVESEGTGDTTRVRAGVAVGDLIPEEWQDVLLGVYVEGMLAGSEDGPRGGFLLELLFPHHLSTTTTYEQPDNWSLDFLWQP